MRRSATVQLTLLASFAAIASSCGRNSEPIVRRCVDGNNILVDESRCAGGGAITPYMPYRWYYGGPGGYFSPGYRMSGGSFEAPRGATSFSSGTARGVIGGAGAAAHGGAGE